MSWDYGCSWGLWLDGRGASPRRLGLSDAFGRQLNAWCKAKDAAYSWDTGWTSDEAMNDHVAEGERLLRQVRAELDGRYTVRPRFGSAEGNDLVCRAIAAGHVARYDPALRVVHPDKRLTPEAVERAARYGEGLGFALRRHGVPASTWAPFLLRPLAGAALSLHSSGAHRPALKDHAVRLDLVAVAPGRWPRHVIDAWRHGDAR